MEGAAEMENILFGEKYRSLIILKRLKLSRKTAEIPIREKLGGMGIRLSLSLLGNKLLAFWSWCDDSVRSRLFALFSSKSDLCLF